MGTGGKSCLWYAGALVKQQTEREIAKARKVKWIKHLPGKLIFEQLTKRMTPSVLLQINNSNNK